MSREDILHTVSRIQRADYEGDRVALERLHDDLAASTIPQRLASRTRYWEGFALWRRAVNGFNEAIEPKALQVDLERALSHFEEAGDADPRFVDARVGAIGCLQTLAFLHGPEPSRAQAFAKRYVSLLNETVAIAPDNPRLLWVLGASQWWTPPDTPAAQVAERHRTAIATYQRGLALSERQEPGADPLEPSWGEPELLMSLAWASLNDTAPNPVAAEEFAKRTLARIPYWHYVRDILMPQIQAALRNR